MKHLFVVGTVIAMLGSWASAQHYPNQPKPEPLVGATATAPEQPAAGEFPVGISLVTPVQAPAADWSVKGLRFNIIYGECHEMVGLDFGLVGQAKEARALQLCVINMADTMKGLQIGVINYAKTAVGVQIGLVNIIADKDWSFLPIVNASF
jgi:hypothetical protein